MPEVKIQKRSNIFVGLGVIMLVLAGFFYLRSRQVTKPELPPLEETLVQEEGAVKKSGGGVKPMTEEEIAQLKKEVDAVLSVSGEGVSLKNMAGSGAAGEAKRAFSDGKFYFKVTASGLALPEKGYYFEGWLKKGDTYISTGRLEVSFEGGGVLYYTASEDRSDYSQVMVTLEPEDGNPAPAKAVLEGSF